MKYICRNDISYFWHRHKKILCIYILIIAVYLGLEIFSNTISKNTFYDALGLQFDVNRGILITIIYIYTMLTYLYISVSVFVKDFKKGIEIIFLRMKSSKWLFYKLVSILLITLVLKFIMYTIVSITVGFEGLSFYPILRIFLTDIIYTSIVQITIILLYILTKKNSIYLLLCLAFLLLIGHYLPTNITNVVDYLYISVALLSALVVASFTFIKKGYRTLFQ